MDKLKTMAKRGIELMDLTTLNDDDTNSIVTQLCKNAKTSVGNTAAVCIFPRFITLAKETLKEQGCEHIKVATVTNFPSGGDDIELAIAETSLAISYGADEIDLVFPYKALIAGNELVGYEMVKACKELCVNGVKLKVIIESGELKTPELIKKASELCIKADADFLKTSTGKVPVNATLEAAEIMLNAIKEHNPNIGFKAAGGVKNSQDVTNYVELAENILGKSWVTTEHFRFGASSLLNNLLSELDLSDAEIDTGGY